MELNEQICEQARLNRDPRFDGRVFIGITSTGIYCRPICPSPHAKRAHVRFFPSAAAASQAGFRPCLRCRPEVAPGTPAWSGTSATVNRGLRLIAEGALDDGSVEMLATRLGVSSRHLSRLFVKHLGALPTAVAQTRRLHFAKQLITDTNLSMTHIAMASGFRSIRRFNDAFRKFYGRPPSELRRAGTRDRTAQNEYEFCQAYRPPYDWDALMAFLAARLTPGVESIRNGTYLRSIVVRGHHGILKVEPAAGEHALKIRIQFPRPEFLLQIVSQVRTMFDLTADPEIIHQHLSSDELLAPLLKRHPGLRLPGAWDGFELIVCAILSQHFPPQDATELAGQLTRDFGETVATANTEGLSHVFPQAQKLAYANISHLPRPCARSIRAAAQILVSAEPNKPFDDILDNLRDIEEIEEPTVQYIAMRVLNDPDAFPATDQMLNSVFEGRPISNAVLRHIENWRPWRGYAAMHLLCSPKVDHEIMEALSAKAV